ILKVKIKSKKLNFFICISSVKRRENKKLINIIGFLFFYFLVKTDKSFSYFSSFQILNLLESNYKE
ncbi:hypothetical protein CON36_31170, partial [Bacillus cereus]